MLTFTAKIQPDKTTRIEIHPDINNPGQKSPHVCLHGRLTCQATSIGDEMNDETPLRHSAGARTMCITALLFRGGCPLKKKQ